MLRNIMQAAKVPLRPIYYELESRVARPYGGRKLDFYFLSTGRCGTRFVARVLDLATNATVYHEPNPTAYPDYHRKADEYFRNPESLKSTDYSQYPMFRRKLRINASVPASVYGVTARMNFPFGVVLHDVIPNKVKLVHLIRNPVDCCRSIIRVESDRYGTGFLPSRARALVEGHNDFDRAISIYVKTNQMIRGQFDHINDPSVCKVVRVEDLSVDAFRELYEFLELEGFDADAVTRVMNDKSDNVRHSHMARLDEKRVPDLSERDIEYIREHTEGNPKGVLSLTILQDDLNPMNGSPAHTS